MIPWPDIETILFDMDGTLLDLHFDNFFWNELVPREYGRRQGLSEAAAKEIIACKYAEVKGSLDWYSIDYWERELRLDIDGLKHSVRDKIAMRPDAAALLQRLGATGKRMLLVTNAHPRSMALKMDATGIADHFHNRISSHHLRLAKENPGFWSALRKIEPFDPANTMLMDDSLPVLRQARREGIRHLYAIARPDSQGPPVAAAEFPQIGDFRDLLASIPEPEPGPAGDVTGENHAASAS